MRNDLRTMVPEDDNTGDITVYSLVPEDPMTNCVFFARTEGITEDTRREDVQGK